MQPYRNEYTYSVINKLKGNIKFDKLTVSAVSVVAVSALIVSITLK
jgi:hypothetical protein